MLIDLTALEMDEFFLLGKMFPEALHTCTILLPQYFYFLIWEDHL